jgi:hypothetical protein
LLSRCLHADCALRELAAQIGVLLKATEIHRGLLVETLLVSSEEGRLGLDSLMQALDASFEDQHMLGVCAQLLDELVEVRDITDRRVQWDVAMLCCGRAWPN